LTPEPHIGGATPFLKWAGGKRWFAERYLHLAPTSYLRFVEPFLGSGAIFFALSPTTAVLSDLNEELIRTYQAVCDSPKEVHTALEIHHAQHSEEHYYQVRSSKPGDDIERAARMIYLNRTCWNGLYRVNKRNEFNVPIGTKTNVLLPTDDFELTSRQLKAATITCIDFEVILDEASSGDFVFVDPPYTVKHNLNGFLKYNDRIFSWSDQVRLRDAVARAAQRGAMVLVTNANHESVRELYRGLGAQSVLGRASVLAASSSYRAKVEELVVRTWVVAEHGRISTESTGPSSRVYST
jgi:DNA adenine methylase